MTEDEAIAPFIPPMPITATEADYMAYTKRAYAEIKRLRAALLEISDRLNDDNDDMALDMANTANTALGRQP